MTWFVIASIIGFWMHRLAVQRPTMWHRAVIALHSGGVNYISSR